MDRFSRCLCGAVFIGLFSAAPGLAQTEATVLPGVVMLAAASEKTAFDDMYDALDGQLIDLDVALLAQWHEHYPSGIRAQIALARQTLAEPDVLLVIWTDLERRDLLFLLFNTEAGERMLIRSSEAQGNTRHETFAIIVRSTASALLRGTPVGLTVEEARATLPPTAAEVARSPPTDSLLARVHSALLDGGAHASAGVFVIPGSRRAPTPSEPPPAVRAWLQAGYAPLGVAPGHPAHGLLLRVGILPWPRWSFHLGYVLTSSLQTTLAQPVVSLKLVRHPFELGVRYHQPLVEGWLSTSFGISVRTSLLFEEVTSPDLTPLDDWALEVSMGADAALHVTPIDSLSVDVAVGFEGALNAHDYVVEANKLRSTVLSTWSVRPLGMLGVTYTFY